MVEYKVSLIHLIWYFERLDMKKSVWKPDKIQNGLGNDTKWLKMTQNARHLQGKIYVSIVRWSEHPRAALL
jgi:hypothetical protein